MVAGMGRCETGADRAITHQDADIVSKLRVMARAQAENKVFYYIAADLVAQGRRYYKKEYPPPAPLAKVQGNQHEEE